MPLIFPYKSEAEWLEMRRHDITSSDISALFDQSPYCTNFELFHRKKSGTELVFEDNDRLRWGRRYEAPTAEGLAEDNGWEIKPLKVYMRHSECQGMGSSFDYEILKDGRIGILEIKTVDFSEFKKKWISEGEDIEAPVHIELQLQHQLEVASSGDRGSYDFGIIAAMIGGNKPIVTYRDRDKEIGRIVVKKINEFWDSISLNREPLPDFSRDGEIIKLLYSGTGGDEIDLSSNNRFADILADYPKLQKAASDAKKLQDAAKTELAAIMKTASLAKCGSTYVTRKTVQRSGYTVEPCSYVDLRIKQPKEK